MADLTQARSAAPPSSRSGRGDARKAFGISSFHWCLVLLAAAGAAALLPLWAPLLLASWTAVAFRPLHTKLARKIGGRNRAAGMVTVLLVAAALLPLLIIGLSLASSAVTLGQQLQKASGAREALHSVFGAPAQGVSTGLDLQQLGKFLQEHRAELWGVVTQFFGAASAAGVGVFVFFYGFYTCLIDGSRARQWLLEHSPLELWQSERLAAAYDEAGRGLLIGVGLTALLQGVVATVGYLVIGVPQAMIFGMLTAFAALIPSIGTALVWVPVAGGLLVAGKTGAAIAVFGLGCLVSVADNFARPVLAKYAQLDLPEYVLLIAMLGGIIAFGAWGLFAGPLFVRLAREALRIAREQRELGRGAKLIDH
jgi:predicted PurR-regulated permease PerM